MSDKLSKIRKVKCKNCGYEAPLANAEDPPKKCPKCSRDLILLTIEDGRYI